MKTLVSTEQFRKEARANRNLTSPVFRVSPGWPEDVEYASRTKRFCLSDGSVDRLGDVIDPGGWDLDDFTRNPVVLWCHDSSAPPIGRASNVAVEGRRLMGDIEFARPETYAFADTIFRLVDGRWLNAVSVGFLPLEYTISSETIRIARPASISRNRFCWKFPFARSRQTRMLWAKPGRKASTPGRCHAGPSSRSTKAATQR